MYKVIVTADGVKVNASKLCQTIKEAEEAKSRLAKCLKPPVRIEITRVSGTR